MNTFKITNRMVMIIFIYIIGFNFFSVKISKCSQNIALNCPYLMTDSNYNITIDVGDKTQLTDGRHSSGIMWKDKESVGWFGFKPVTIIVDLLAKKSISGVSFSTVTGGKNGPQYPESIMILVSDDCKHWYFLTDLVDSYNKIDREKYEKFDFLTTNLKSWGRYLQFFISPNGRYVIADELEVISGSNEWIEKVDRGDKLTDVFKFHKDHLFDRLIIRQLSIDLDFIENDVSNLSSEQIASQGLEKTIKQLKEKVNKFHNNAVSDFNIIVPINDLEKTIFQFQAKVWRLQSKPLLRVWKTNRWDPLLPIDEPTQEHAIPTKISFTLMNGEIRGDALNLTNSSAEKIKCYLNITGLPGPYNPSYLGVYHCISTGTRRTGIVTSALINVDREPSGYGIEIYPGITTQIWISCNPTNLEKGKYIGDLTIEYDGRHVEAITIELNISNLKFPKNQSLIVSGWDYTNLVDSGISFNAVTHENQNKIIKTLQYYRVNAPWAFGNVMPLGHYAPDGGLIQFPETKMFNDWVRLWPDAKIYIIYLRPFRSFGGTQPESPFFSERIADWGSFWTRHLRKLGIDPHRIVICIQDEPSTSKQFMMVHQWSKAIKNAAPEFRIFENPHFKGEAGELKAMADVDVLAAHRRYWFEDKKGFRSVFKNLQNKGKQLWFYSPDRHPRSLDPYTYYLGQAWHAFKEGATGTAFWSFTDMRNTPTWNEYLADENGPFSPLFIDKDAVTGSKYMEAIREGAQDYEYLVMLKDAVARTQHLQPALQANARARETLARACDRVLQIDQERYYQWHVRRDRSVADSVRLEILDRLEALSPYLESGE